MPAPMMPEKRLQAVELALIDAVKDIEMSERGFVHVAAPYFGIYFELQKISFLKMFFQ